MANKSGWKNSETKAAALFPGGRRRTRVGGGTYAEIADDVIWGPERREEKMVMIKVPIRIKDPKTGKKKKTGKTRMMRIFQPRVFKLPLIEERGFTDEDGACYESKIEHPPVYIEVKKRTRVSEAVFMLRAAMEKYIPAGEDAHVVLVQHPKGMPVQYVTITDKFFKELIRSWCQQRELFMAEIGLEKENE